MSGNHWLTVMLMDADAASSCTIDTESVPGAVVAVIVGDLILENMTVWAREIWAVCEPEQLDILWDLREARFDTDITNIRTLSEFVIKSSPKYNYKAAYLTANNLQYGLIRMFLAFRGTRQVTTAVFRTMERAQRWLTDEL